MRGNGQLSETLARLLREALEEERMSQADLGVAMGLSPKHINAMVNGKSGALAAYEFAAFALGRRWNLTLDRQVDDDRGAGQDG